MTQDRKITITLTDARPVRVTRANWPIVAQADRHDGEVECQANHLWSVRVREHADGRRIVYGVLEEGNGGTHRGWRGARGGYRVAAIARGVPDDAATVRALRACGDIIDDAKLAAECIADLPPEELDGPDAPAAPADAPVERVRLAHLLALLVQAETHVPAALADEIREALAGRP